MAHNSTSAPATTWRVRSVPDLTIGVLVILTGVAVIIYASSMPRLHTGAMGPGLFPTTVGIFLAIFGSILIFQTVRPRADEPTRQPLLDEVMNDDATPDAEEAANVSVVAESPKRLALNALVVAAGVVAYILLAEPLGFSLTMLLILGAIQRVLGASWKSTVLVSAGLTLGLYLMFEKLLLVQLPNGLLGF